MKQILRVVTMAVLVALLSWGSVARGFAQEATGRPFITKWQGKAGEELKFPIVGTEYKLVIKNEKGEVVKSEEEVTVEGEGGAYYHAFTPEADGVYTVEAGPEGVKAMQMRAVWKNGGWENGEWKDGEWLLFTSNAQLLEVVQFGTVGWESMKKMFRLCEKMTFAAGIDTPDLTKVTDMSEMFRGCRDFNQPLEKWNVSQVTSMRGMFNGCSAFNQPLEKWTVSQVTDMSWMFEDCSAFNQPLEKWDVSKVSIMWAMFERCLVFNQPLEKWDVSKVTDMRWMFDGCNAFNQPLEKWDVSQVTNMERMFAGCTAFNQPLEKWTVSQVTNMSKMLYDCSAFNQPLEKWNVSQVTDMSGMFAGCSAFNQPLEKWDVSKVTDMNGMFSGCSAFNQPLEKWNVSQVTSMNWMFRICRTFNQPLEKWTVSQVTSMESMFEGCSAFNQPLEKWTVSQVTDMREMFSGCSAFNQPLGAWKLRTAIGGLSTTSMSAVNYSLSLIGWAKQIDGASNIPFGEEVKGLIYNDAGREAREKLIARGWTFEGDIYQPREKVAISLAKEGEGTLAIESYNDDALKAVAVGTELTVTATPKDGYSLTSLMAGTQDILATKKFTVTGALTVKAVFKTIEEAPKVAIFLAKEGEGTLAIEGYNDAALQAVAVGTELTAIATPKEGYTLASLTAGTQNILATKKFTVTGAVTVKAVFKKKKVAISLAKEGEGTLAIEGYNDEALKAVAVGTTLTVTVTPKEGYTLTSLTAGTQDILATKKFTVTEAVTVKAVFKTIEEAPKVAISLAKEGEGTLAIEGYNDEALKTVAVGTELTVIATPKEGYTLTSLTAGTQDILATKKFTVTGAVTVKAVFKKKGNNGGGNNGGGNGGGSWQPQTPQAVEDVVLASLAVAPNPFTAQLRIDNPEGITARYELVNASGVVVRFGAFSATEVLVDTEALPAGLYLVRITAQNGAKRVVKVKILVLPLSDKEAASGKTGAASLSNKSGD